MILGANAGSNVCLRCRKLQTKTFLSPELLHLPLRRHSRRIRFQHNEARLGDPELYPRAHDIGHEQHNECMRDSKSPRGDSHSTPTRWFKVRKDQSTRHLFGRLYGIRGHQKREHTVELDTRSLGSPSEVIILRDSRIKVVPSRVEDAKIPDRVDILAQLDAERGLTSLSEVHDNIELLMPKDGTKAVSWTELHAIQDHLSKGFTIAQLAEYIHSYDAQYTNAKSRDKGQRKPEAPSSIRRKTTWMAGISETGGNFEENHKRGYGSEAFTRKQQLVLLLLRQCWGLEVQEVTESIGEMELHLEQKELELLIKGRKPPLKLIIDQLISNREETIEAFRSRAVVRITAPKEKCEIIVSRILKVLQDVQHLEINLEALLSSPQSQGAQPGPYEKDVLEELARLTETEIMRLSDSKLRISSIHKNSRTSLSTPTDVARRLLLTSSDLIDDTKTYHGCSHASPPFLATKYQFRDGMLWHNRLRNWMRWTSSVPKLPLGIIDGILPDMETPDLTAERDHKTPKVSDEHHLQSLTRSSTINDNKFEQQSVDQIASDTIHWDQNCVTSTSVIVGHVLHLEPTAQEAVIKNAELVIPKQTIFKPATINLSRLLSSMKEPISSLSETVIMRFVPSPWTIEGDVSRSKFPHMEMIFTVDSKTKELIFEKLVAIVESNTSDLMLLSSSLDLRFQQRSTASLQMSNSQQLSQIRDFLESSRLKIRQGQLETPPRLSLPVSKHLCRPDVSRPSSHSHAEYIDVEYLFLGLEHRNTAVISFEGWELNYTSIEGGKANGLRGELSLLPHRLQNDGRKGQDDSAPSQEQHTEQFISAAYRLINKLDGFSNPGFTPVLGSSTTKMAKAMDGNRDDFPLFQRAINFKGLAKS